MTGSMSNLTRTIVEEQGIIVSYLLCTMVSLLLGCMIAYIYSKHEKYNHSYLAAIILMPAVVQTVIMLVNGNIGMGVAVAGAFSLIRFRSIPGNAKDIVVVFMAMATGLATGTGYLLIAIVFAIVLSAVMYVVGHLKIGISRQPEKLLKITIPESLDYENVFDEIFEKHTKSVSLEQVKTASLGSLYNLSYKIVMNGTSTEKELVDAIRCRNGNLEISIGRVVESTNSL